MGIISRAMLHSWEEMGCLDDNNSEELINMYEDTGEKPMNEIEQFKAENERLKQQLAEIGKSWDEIQRIREEKEKLIEQLVIYNQFENSYNKYRTTLQEIKAIAEKTGCRAILDLITKAESEEE